MNSVKHESFIQNQLWSSIVTIHTVVMWLFYDCYSIREIPLKQMRLKCFATSVVFMRMGFEWKELYARLLFLGTCSSLFSNDLIKLKSTTYCHRHTLISISFLRKRLFPYIFSNCYLTIQLIENFLPFSNNKVPNNKVTCVYC